MKPKTRRTVIRGAAATVSIAAIAGCLGDDDDDADDDNGDPVEDWLGPAPNWEGEITDWTGEESVTVENGDPDGGNNYRFEPPAIRIDVGTTVEWEWVDDDNHSVEEIEQDAFASDIKSGEGTTFEFTFDEEGTYLYECGPHRAQNQRGAVIVE